MPSAVHVFNQYYWDLLKKVKDLAKDLKYKGDDHGARAVLAAIKKSYMTFDKTSSEHVKWYVEHAAALDAFLEDRYIEEAPTSNMGDWYSNEAIAPIELYNGITIEMIARLFRNKSVILYYIVLMSIFAASDIPEEELNVIIDVLKKQQPWADEDLASPSLSSSSKSRLAILRDVLRASVKATPSPADAPNPDGLMNELENTSLGRLAKEIMNDVDVEEISKSIGDDGDILKALANPDGGITKLLGTVSQKMIAKLASGELKQDTLMQDAMKLAGVLPGMTGGGNKAMDGLGNMASMMEQVSKMAGMFGGANKNDDGSDDENMDMSSMISQLSKMMGGTKGGGARGTKTAVDHNALNRAVRSKQMRRKLDERRRKHEQP